MKRTMVISTMVALLLAATNITAAFAGDSVGDITLSGDNTNINKNKLIVTPTTRSDATGGNATVNYTERMQLPGAPYLPTVGLPYAAAGSFASSRLVTQGNLNNELAAFPRLSVTQVETAIGYMGKVEGSESWGLINDRIIVYPVVINPQLALGKNEAVRFVDPDRVSFSGSEVVARYTYKGKDKGNPVLLAHFLLRVAADASKVGANVVVVTDQYHQVTIKSKAEGVSVGGFFSKILDCFSGGSLGAGGSLAGGSITEFGSAGISVTMLRVNEQQPPVCPPPVVQKYQYQSIERLEEVVKFCPKPCYNNASLRKQLGDSYAKKGYFSEAIKQYATAEKDILKGAEPSGMRTVEMQAGKDLLFVVRYNALYSILRVKGEGEEISQAQVWKIKFMPDCIEDLKN